MSLHPNLAVMIHDQIRTCSRIYRECGRCSGGAAIPYDYLLNVAIETGVEPVGHHRRSQRGEGSVLPD
jgi:hypothetical protein